jgi:hypothetical protein
VTSTVLADANRGNARASNFLAAAMPRSQLDGAMRKSRQPRCAAANSNVHAANHREAAGHYSKSGSGNFAARPRKGGGVDPNKPRMAST